MNTQNNSSKTTLFSDKRKWLSAEVFKSNSKLEHLSTGNVKYIKSRCESNDVARNAHCVSQLFGIT